MDPLIGVPEGPKTVKIDFFAFLEFFFSGLGLYSPWRTTFGPLLVTLVDSGSIQTLSFDSLTLWGIPQNGDFWGPKRGQKGVKMGHF